MRFEDEMAHPCIFFWGGNGKIPPPKKTACCILFSLRSSMALTSKRRDFFLRDAHRTPRKKHLNYLENLVSECCPFCVKKWVVGSWMEVGPWFMIQTHFFWFRSNFRAVIQRWCSDVRPNPQHTLATATPERGALQGFHNQPICCPKLQIFHGEQMEEYSIFFLPELRLSFRWSSLRKMYMTYLFT